MIVEFTEDEAKAVIGLLELAGGVQRDPESDHDECIGCYTQCADLMLDEEYHGRHKDWCRVVMLRAKFGVTYNQEQKRWVYGG